MGRNDVKVAQEVSAFLGVICGADEVTIGLPGEERWGHVQWSPGVRHRDALKELKALWDTHCITKWPVVRDSELPNNHPPMPTQKIDVDPES